MITVLNSTKNVLYITHFCYYSWFVTTWNTITQNIRQLIWNTCYYIVLMTTQKYNTHVGVNGVYFKHVAYLLNNSRLKYYSKFICVTLTVFIFIIDKNNNYAYWFAYKYENVCIYFQILSGHKYFCFYNTVFFNRNKKFT